MELEKKNWFCWWFIILFLPVCWRAWKFLLHFSTSLVRNAICLWNIYINACQQSGTCCHVLRSSPKHFTGSSIILHWGGQCWAAHRMCTGAVGAFLLRSSCCLKRNVALMDQHISNSQHETTEKTETLQWYPSVLLPVKIFSSIMQYMQM